jgi:ABC-type antimicrobial peptide transport system permease subunit
MKLLFINALKGLKKKKVQMFGIIVMVMLSTGIYTSMNTALDRLEDRYYNYLDEQNVEDFSFIPVIDYMIDVTTNDIDLLRENELSTLNEDEKVIINNYYDCLENGTEACNQSLYMNVKNIFEKYDAYIYIANKKVDSIKEQYDFEYQIEKAKIMSHGRYITKAMPYINNKLINKTYLLEGQLPINDNEITVLPKFAKNNNLKIGDDYELGDKTYTIVGYTYAPDHVYPLISFSMPIFDEKYNNIIFMTEKAYSDFFGVKEDVYVAKFNFDYDNDINVSFQRNNKNTNDENLDILSKINKNENDKLMMSFSTVTRIMRVNAIQMEFSSNRTFAETFLYLLLGISVFIIVVITKKRIDDERLQIGVLKSLGYNSFAIATSYLVYPIIGSILGGILGYLIGISLNTFLTTQFLSYYNVPLVGFVFNINYLLKSVFVPMIVLSLLSYLIAIFMLRKKPLYLLKEGSNLKINVFSKIVTKITSFLPFDYRFKYSLAFRSLGKLIIVSLTSFCTGLLIVLILIGYNLFNSMIERSFEGMDYKYMVNYITPQFDEDQNDDLVLEISQTLVSIKDKNGNDKKLEEEGYDITLTGIDSATKYLNKDKNKNNIIPQLFVDDNIIINENIKEVMKIETGDTLIFNYNGSEISYTVVGVTEEYIGRTAYVDREQLSTIMGFPKIAYTKKYSEQSKYANMSELSDEELSEIASIFSMEDLKRNISNQMQTANSAIYFVIFFASFMALIIIAVVANIVVEENKKTISLMKVMGYKNPKISSIVLNIYTPFVIVAYLASIPVMIYVLKKIVKSLVGDMGLAIPISLSPLMAIIGLIGLVVSYYIAISLSRRVLNKVPLAIALKRE